MLRRRNVITVLAAALAWLALGCGQSPAPRGTACDDPDDGTVTALVLGNVFGDFPDGAFTFEPWGEGAPVNVVRGGQGADMIFAGVAFEGSPPPNCAEVSFEVSDADGGELIAAQTDLLGTEALADGRRTTGPVQLVLGFFPNSGALLIVRAEAGGQTSEARVIAGMPRPPAILPRGLRLTADPSLVGPLAVGDVLELRVDLGEPAPVGGAEVGLVSLDEAVVEVAVDILTLPEGEQDVTFAITAVDVGETSVTATWAEMSDTLTFTVE